MIKLENKIGSGNEEIKIAESKKEKITTNLDLVLSLKDQFGSLSEKLKQTGEEIHKKFKFLKPQDIGKIQGEVGAEPKKFTVIDAGSQVIPLAIDRIYFYCALSINEKKNKLIEGPYIKTLSEIEKEENKFVEEGYLRVRDAINLMRETLILKMAIEDIERRSPDLILIDGPLIIRDAYKRFQREKIKSFDEFMKSLIKLEKLSAEREIPLIGFVKRAQSRFYLRDEKILVDAYARLRDPIFLDIFLEKGDYFPNPPRVPKVKSFESISLKYTYTYFKTQNRSPYSPFRIDFNSVASKNYKTWLKWLLENSSNSANGLPNFLHMVDSEVTMKEILSRALYSDMVRKIPFDLRYICKLEWGE